MRSWNNRNVGKRSRRTTLVLFMVLGLTPLSPVYSQNPTWSPQGHQGNRATDSSMIISQQLIELRGNIARLEAALEQDHRGSVSLVNAQMGMDPMGCGEGGCGQPSSGMKTGKMSGMGKEGMGSRRMGMENMGMMGKMRTRKGRMSGRLYPGFLGHLISIILGEPIFSSITKSTLLSRRNRNWPSIKLKNKPCSLKRPSIGRLSKPSKSCGS